MDGHVLHRELEAERGHAELILSMIDELLRESATQLSQLQAIAFGRGPGSFTGVRLAASVTQGLAFGAGVPVVPVSDLRAVAQRVMSSAHNVLVCNDARMHEVYWGCFVRGADGLMLPVTDERVSKPAEVRVPPEWANTPVAGVGRGFAAYPMLADQLAHIQSAYIEPGLLPRAHEVAVLAVADVQAGRLKPAAEAVPVYIRDDVARPKPP